MSTNIENKLIFLPIEQLEADFANEGRPLPSSVLIVDDPRSASEADKWSEAIVEGGSPIIHYSEIISLAAK